MGLNQPTGRVFGYARCSTTKQDLAVQIAELEAAGCTVYREKLSGGNLARPQLKRLLREVLPGDEVVVYKLDRVSRSLRDMVNLLHELTEQGVLVRSLHDSVDTRPKDDPFEEAMRQAFIGMVGLFAEFERAITRARTSAGREHARSNGVPFGRDPALTPSQVARARRLHEQGDSVAGIARDLGVHRATLYRYLGDEDRAERASKVLAERESRRRRR